MAYPGEIHKGDWVSWSWPAARADAPRELHQGIVVRAARDGSWADVCDRCALDMRQEGYAPEDCHLSRRHRAVNLRLVRKASEASS